MVHFLKNPRIRKLHRRHLIKFFVFNSLWVIRTLKELNPFVEANSERQKTVNINLKFIFRFNCTDEDVLAHLDYLKPPIVGLKESDNFHKLYPYVSQFCSKSLIFVCVILMWWVQILEAIQTNGGFILSELGKLNTFFFWIVGKILTRGLSTMMRIFSVIFEGSYKNHKQSTLGWVW